MNDSVEDLRQTIVPRSDQLNSEQLLSGPITITVSAVRMGATKEQPVEIHYPNEEGRPYKPCLTMRKVLVFAWGENGHSWVGRSMTLYNDQSVKFGGMDVGGIRISHLSDIEKDIRVSLTATKGKKALHEIKVMQRQPAAKATQRPARTERHDSMVADFELVAREQGFEAFKASWARLAAEDRAAIGTAERDRIGAIGNAADEARKPAAA